MVKKFKELILTEDTVFEESIEVETSIRCAESNRFSLKVVGNINAWDINAGDIDARNIDARNINAWDIDARNIDAGDIDAGNIDARNIDARNINAWDIDARNIDAGDIDARNINAWDIICESRNKKSKTDKTIARVFVPNRSKLERKEQKKEL